MTKSCNNTASAATETIINQAINELDRSYHKEQQTNHRNKRLIGKHIHEQYKRNEKNMQIKDSIAHKKSISKQRLERQSKRMQM